MQQTDLKQHQAVLYELLLSFDAICQKHNIHYMLFAGTALGAVRHQGFIPWDDDLDVVMLRSEYERFLFVAPQELDAQWYYLQKEFSPHWPMFFSKLRKNGTTCLERYIPRDEQMHQGIYIDIFPCDDLAAFPPLRWLQFMASKIVIAQSLDKRGYVTRSAVKKLFLCAARRLPCQPLVRFICRSRDRSAMVHTFFGGASRYRKNVYPRSWFEETVPMRFESGQFPVSAHYDELLTRLYGDYHTPLPPEKREYKVHAVVVDTNTSYQAYLAQHRKSNFQQLTRSIR